MEAFEVFAIRPFGLVHTRDDLARIEAASLERAIKNLPEGETLGLDFSGVKTMSEDFVRLFLGKIIPELRIGGYGKRGLKFVGSASPAVLTSLRNNLDYLGINESFLPKAVITSGGKDLPTKKAAPEIPTPHEID
jgi:hypothetical protein